MSARSVSHVQAAVPLPTFQAASLSSGMAAVRDLAAVQSESPNPRGHCQQEQVVPTVVLLQDLVVVQQEKVVEPLAC